MRRYREPCTPFRRGREPRTRGYRMSIPAERVSASLPERSSWLVSSQLSVRGPPGSSFAHPKRCLPWTRDTGMRGDLVDRRIVCLRGVARRVAKQARRRYAMSDLQLAARPDARRRSRSLAARVFGTVVSGSRRGKRSRLSAALLLTRFASRPRRKAGGGRRKLRACAVRRRRDPAFPRPASRPGVRRRTRAVGGCGGWLRRFRDACR